MASATFTATFTSHGTFTWVAPTGVTSAQVECWGAGGGGNGQTCAGGGGEYAAEPSQSVSAGTSYTVVVGTAGTAGSTSGGNGGNSTFNSTSVVAHGGSGAPSSGTAGGAGGTGSANTTHHNGGPGGKGGDSGSAGGGGGGGSAGPSSVGNTGPDGSGATPGSGATAVTGGGPGGNGCTAGSVGHAPASGPGGGGGGGWSPTGGAGFDGQVVITWTMASPAVVTGTTSTSGTYKWTAPAATATVDAAAVGGGGAGGGATSTTSTTGGGGGGGEYAEETSLAVTAGSSYTFTIGAAGAGVSGGTGGSGTNTTMAGDAVTVTAHGGGGGAEGTNGTAGSAGTGSANTIHHDGGAGHVGVTNSSGGGGGGSGGSGSAGNAGNAQTGASAVTGGGPGGNGASAGSSGGSAPASGPGGGGGGARGGTGNQTGGAGFAGQLTLTWGSINTTGSIKLPKPVLAGAGFKGTITTGSVALPKPSLKGNESLHTSGGLALPKPRLSGAGLKGSVFTGSVKLPKPALAGTEHELFTSAGSLALSPLAIAATGKVQYAIPPGPVRLLIELLVGGTWTDITDLVYARDNISIIRGRPDESQQPSPAQATMTLNNRDGRFALLNPASPYYGLIGRNTQLRVSAPSTGIPPFDLVYRFWGEVSAWPPAWDPTGTDVYVQITASGILRRLLRSAVLRSALFRYYSTLTGTSVPLAYWPGEDGSSATQIASGVPGGFAMTFTGTPQLASDTAFACASGLPQMNGAVFAGATGIAGALPVANSAVFTSSGSWIAPAGITAVLATCWGAGGGGSASNGSTGGAGGGGGEYASASLAVTPGHSYSYTVGHSTAGGNGGNTTMPGDSATSIVAHGGAAGSSDGATGGAGGTGSSAATHFDGGAGAAGSGGPGGSGSTTQSSQSFTSSGTWSAPSDISGNPTVYLWGAGGGGGGGGSSSGGGGGGGGGFTSASPSVSGGSNYSVTVGTGGSGGTKGNPGSAGGDSKFNSGNTAHGGSSGFANGSGGSGGSGNTSDGGNGADSAQNPGAGGGGGAALGGNGGAGFNAGSGSGGGEGADSGGLDTGGGAGGSGGVWNSFTGKGGSAPGGGGGGGYTNSGANGAAGGAGNRGKVEVFWNESTGAPDAAIGGGGGSSGGSSSAGNDGDTEAGGAAVAGGGPGGGTLAGSTFTAAPTSTPGGGGGGYDSLGNAAAGAGGLITLSYAASGGGSGVADNVLSFLLHLPDSSTTDGAVIARMYTTGTISWVDVIYHTGGNLQLTGFTAAGAQLFTTGSIAFSADGALLLVQVTLATSGGNVTYDLTAFVAGTDAAVADSNGTQTGASLGDPFQIVINPNGTLTDTSFGHVAVSETAVTLSTLMDPAGAYSGEYAGDRFTRLCGEEGVPATLVGTNTDTEIMGPQLPGEQLVALLQECEDADRGLIYEPRDSFGLAYRTRVDLYNQDPAITLNYTAGQLAQPIQPTEDDQLIRNDVTASRPSGSSSEQMATTGGLSTADPPDGVGPYTFSFSPNVQSDGQLADLASWVLRVGTVDEPRYPVITVDLMRAEMGDTFDGIVATDIGDHLQVVNPPSWLPPRPIDQLVYGYTETLNAFMWTIAMNCVPEDPYEIATAYDTGAGVGARADTDGSSLHNGIGTGDTSFSVDTPSPNAVWVDSTGYSAEFPFDVIISGEQMTVTGISGTTTPQAFTVTRAVNGVQISHNAGEPVSLYQPAYVAL